MSTYSTKPTTFEALTAPFPEAVQAVAYRLRALVYEALPDVEERIYGGTKVGNALYSTDGPSHVICGIQPGDDGCRLYVHHVTRFEHPALKLEGKGKHTRHVKFHDIDAVDAEAVRWLVDEARKGAS